MANHFITISIVRVQESRLQVHTMEAFLRLENIHFIDVYCYYTQFEVDLGTKALKSILELDLSEEFSDAINKWINEHLSQCLSYYK